MKKYAVIHANRRGIQFFAGDESVQAYQEMSQTGRGPYEVVALVEAPNLDHVYFLTQNGINQVPKYLSKVEESWINNKVVTPLKPAQGYRSTSVGDVILDLETRQAYMVDSFGFKEVTPVAEVQR